MKVTPLWMGMTFLALVSCEKEQPAAAPEASKRSTYAERRAAAKAKPVEPAAPDAGQPPAEATPPPVMPPAASGSLRQAPPAADLAGLTPEEREARQAAELEQRIVLMTERATARMKEWDANGDGVIPKDEAPEAMQRAFEQMDTSGDGSLDAAEQAAAIQAMAERMSGLSRLGRSQDQEER